MDMFTELSLLDIRQKRWEASMAPLYHTPMTTEGGSAMRRNLESVVNRLTSAERHLDSSVAAIEEQEADGVMRITRD